MTMLDKVTKEAVMAASRETADYKLGYLTGSVDLALHMLVKRPDLWDVNDVIRILKQGWEEVKGEEWKGRDE